MKLASACTYVDGVSACTTRDFGYKVLNLGESQTERLDELIGLIERALGTKALIDRQPPLPGDMPVTYADISKVRAKLGCNPQTIMTQASGSSWSDSGQTAIESPERLGSTP